MLHSFDCFDYTALILLPFGNFQLKQKKEKGGAKKKERDRET